MTCRPPRPAKRSPGCFEASAGIAGARPDGHRHRPRRNDLAQSLAVIWPARSPSSEAHGGTGAGHVELGIVMEEMAARCCAPFLRRRCWPRCWRPPTTSNDRSAAADRCRNGDRHLALRRAGRPRYTGSAVDPAAAPRHRTAGSLSGAKNYVPRRCGGRPDLRVLADTDDGPGGVRGGPGRALG